MELLFDLSLWRVAELVLVVHKMIPKWFEETHRICQRAWKKFTNHLLFQILLLFGAVKARKEKGDKWHLMVVGFSAKRHEVNTTGKSYTMQRRAIIWKWCSGSTLSEGLRKMCEFSGKIFVFPPLQCLLTCFHRWRFENTAALLHLSNNAFKR